ncbi:MAG TPA: metallophosphoesterase, partial [Gemmatimonadales bacterium]|nr:metallophosphoesterase [Gemmatimonadales bacterium]
MIPTRTLRTLVACGLAAAPALLLPGTPLAAQDTAHVVLVSTTDIHGHATGWDFIEGRPFPGGLTRAASVIDSLRAKYPGQVVLVDAGDLLAGDPFDAYFAGHPRTPHPLIEAMDALEYDAIVPGNHEFNYGYEYFRQAFTGRNFRPVCAN